MPPRVPWWPGKGKGVGQQTGGCFDPFTLSLSTLLGARPGVSCLELKGLPFPGPLLGPVQGLQKGTGRGDH